jgi:hypothetical protein
MKRAALSLVGVLLASCSAGSAPDDARPSASAPSASMTSDKNTFVELVLTLPPGFTLGDDTRTDVPSPIPGQAAAAEYFRSYTGPRGRGLYFFAWDGHPTRDRGPMMAVETWKAPVGSQEASVSRTSHFFGQEQEVLAAHFEGPPPARRRYMIYTKPADRAMFDALLSAIRFSPASR